jgi:DNA segregation ATPase FtsK/SpoIIIE, S-DNA-T family
MKAFLVLVAVLVLIRLAVAVVRFALLPSSARRHYPAVLWHRWRWRWLAANLRLSYPDRHRRSWRPRLPFGTSVMVAPDTGGPVKHRVPRVRFKADPAGWTVKVRLTPGVSRPEYERNSEHLANSWGAHRVGISQPRPGRLLLKVVRQDPLLTPVSSGILPVFDGRHIVLGADEWGQVRRVSLANISGSVIGGSPGAGKTTFGAAMAVQLAPAESTQWYLLDGKNGGDWSEWAGRAIAYAGDQLDQAQGVLELAHGRMTSRLASVRTDLGCRNAWRIGPSKDYPLVWVCVDECSSYLDLEAAKALGREVEKQVRACRMLLTEMLRKGRSVMYHTSLFAQKATSGSIPTDIRDLAGLRACFQVPTLESGIAVLGEDLRRYESASPTMLQGEQFAGVATVRLATGTDIYTRLRAPDVSEHQADEVAKATAHLREGYVPVPDDVRELVA